jgi:anti-anti-sigma regulatory factor
MDFKIDTKKSYTHIIPVTERLDANLTEAIRQKWNNTGQSGSLNLIVDLQDISQIDDNALDELLALQEDFKKNRQSIVFMGLPEQHAFHFKETGEEMAVNLVPTLAEAVDIVNMEILERDLFDEEV